MNMTMEPTGKKRPPNKFSGWEKVQHPSRPIVATRQIPHHKARGEDLVAGVWGRADLTPSN